MKQDPTKDLREFYGEYTNNIFTELSLHLHKHMDKVSFWLKHRKGKEPSYVKKHKKLIDLYWKSCGMWKKENRQ